MRVKTRLDSRPPSDWTTACGALHVRQSRVVACEAQCDVGLDGRGEVGRTAVERGPAAVVALLRPDPAGGLGRLALGADAEELAQQQVLGLDGDVGLELALPPPGGVLGTAQIVDRCLHGGGDSLRTRQSDGHQCSRPTTNRPIAASSPATSEGTPASRSRSSPASTRRAASSSAQVLPPASSTRRATAASRCSVSPEVSTSQARSSRGGAAPAAEGVAERQGVLARPEVGHHRLAGHLGVAPDAEQVVDELEGNAQLVAEALQSGDQAWRRSGKDGADRSARRHQ